MRAVAILAVRNEERVLETCLAHLARQGLETCLIDNGSTDGTLAIAERFRDRGVFRIEALPWTGAFELEAQLRLKERLADEIDADWFLHCDADEIREAPRPFSTLVEGFAAAERAGANAIDFDEFVFLPTSDDEPYEGRDFVAEMRRYYYYEPTTPDRARINAWRRAQGVDLRSLAGHEVRFPGRRIFHTRFILRHYIALSRAHVVEKYGGRIFAAAERARAWHGDRATFDPARLALPAPESLKLLGPDGVFDTRDPRSTHPLFPPVVAPGGGARERLRRFRDESGGRVPRIAPVSSAGARPLWTVAVPTFEPVARHLADALRSVLAQDPGPDELELVVVDDASPTVDVGAIVRDVCGPRARFVRNERNRGLVGNWNQAIALSHGRWVHLLHQDDIAAPGFYVRLREPCLGRATLVAAFCRAGGLDDEGRPTSIQRLLLEAAGVVPDFARLEAAEHRLVTPAIVVRRAAYEEVGGYHEGLPYCADWDMVKRLSVLGEVWYEPGVVARWRSHERQETARLRRTGADLEDRRRSIALSRAYLPSDAYEASLAPALRGSIASAAVALGEHMSAGRLGSALAQAEAIAAAIREALGLAAPVPASGGEPRPEHTERPERAECARLRAEIDRLAAEVQGWTIAAELLAAARPASERRG